MKNLYRRIRGASLTEYGLLVSLVAVVAIFSVGRLGQETGGIFCIAGNALPFSEGVDCSDYEASATSDIAGTGSDTETADPFDQPTDTLDLVYTVPASGTVTMRLIGDTSRIIDWGDGSEPEPHSTTSNASHTYDSAGTYTVSVSGSAKGFSNMPPYDYITEVSSWGDIGLTSMSLYQAVNITSVAHPTAAMTALSTAFKNVPDVPDSVSTWDVSNVTHFSGLFENSGGVPDLSGWDTGSAIHMSSLFEDADMVDQDLSGWDTSNVMFMSYLFYGMDDNVDISGWNTAKVENMYATLRDATGIESDISGWNVGNVTDCRFFSDGSGIAASSLPSFTSCTP